MQFTRVVATEYRMVLSEVWREARGGGIGGERQKGNFRTNFCFQDPHMARKLVWEECVAWTAWPEISPAPSTAPLRAWMGIL